MSGGSVGGAHQLPFLFEPFPDSLSGHYLRIDIHR